MQVNTELMKAINEFLSNFSKKEDGGYDGWMYFFMSGLSFGFIEPDEKIGEDVIAGLKHRLNAQQEDRISFSAEEILTAAIRVFNHLKDNHVPPEELAQAIVDDALFMAREYAKTNVVPPDVSWTCFQMGWKYKFLSGTAITVTDPNTNQEKSFGPWR